MHVRHFAAVAATLSMLILAACGGGGLNTGTPGGGDNGGAGDGGSGDGSGENGGDTGGDTGNEGSDDGGSGDGSDADGGDTGNGGSDDGGADIEMSLATSAAVASVFNLTEGRTSNIRQVAIPISGSGHEMVVQTSPPRYAQAAPYHNSLGALEFVFSSTSAASRQNSLVQWQGRSVIESELVEDHSLGSQWQLLEGTKQYTTGGKLTVNLATDADRSVALEEPWVGYGRLDRTILLDDIPDLLAEHDWQGVRVPGGGLEGSLDGTQGTFTCVSDPCWLEVSPPPKGYYPYGNSVAFTPADGSPTVTLNSTYSREVSTVNYLSFGYWLYLPDEAAGVDSAEFGVLAGGGDPFNPSHIGHLTGTASYAGKAIGMYFESSSASSANAGSFDADVEVVADFGTISDVGTLRGRVHNFAGVPASFPRELGLETTSISSAMPVVGFASAETDDRAWLGEWGAAFFGNGATPSEHPTGVAGTFGATTIDRASGFAGAFAAHRQ